MTTETQDTATERFERLADAFHRATGMMAPGKDDASGAHSYEARSAAWIAWLASRREGAAKRDVAWWAQYADDCERHARSVKRLREAERFATIRDGLRALAVLQSQEAR
jgi:hypothetical protein